MVRKTATLAAPLLLAALTAPAAAADWSLGVGVSTLGFGVEAGYPFNDRFALRLAAYAAKVSQDGQESGIDFNSDLNLSNVGAYLDWHPFAGAFRISAGLFATDNNLDAVGKPGAGGTTTTGGSGRTSAGRQLVRRRRRQHPGVRG